MSSFKSKFPSCYRNGEINPYFLQAMVASFDHLQELKVSTITADTLFIPYSCRDGSRDDFQFTPVRPPHDTFFTESAMLRVHSIGGSLKNGGSVSTIKEKDGVRSRRTVQMYTAKPRDVVNLFLDILEYKFNHLTVLCSIFDRTGPALHAAYPNGILLGEHAVAKYGDVLSSFVLYNRHDEGKIVASQQEVVSQLRLQIQEIEKTMIAALLLSRFD